MKEEKLVLNNMLSWQDIINFSLTDYTFGFSFLEKSFYKKSQDKEVLNNYIRSFLGNAIRNEFPDFPFDDECFNYYFYIKKDNEGKNNLYLSFGNFFIDLFAASVNHHLDKNRLAHLLKLDNPNLKEDVIRELKSYKDNLNKEIDRCGNLNMIMGYNIDYGIKITKEELKETLFAKRKMVIWIIRNYDKLFKFVQKPLDLEILKFLNKDKFLLVMASLSLEKSDILSDNISNSQQNQFEMIHNYLLLVDYLSEENKQKYFASISLNLKNGQSLLITSDTIFSEYHKFYSRHKEFLDSYNFASSYEEILQNHAEETWKRLQSEKLVKSIQVSWEMIPVGEKMSLENYRKNNRARIVSTSDKKQAELKKAYDLVEEKMNYFYNSNPVVNLRGIHTFEGYEAYMYSNGVVVFEKFYKPRTVRTVDSMGKKQKEIMMVPVDGEAIYVMNFRNFAEYSKYSKLMLIEESSHNSEVKRIIHTSDGSWKNRVDKVIYGPGYGELDLGQVDEIAKQLAKRV